MYSVLNPTKVRVFVLNSTFNNISVISWQSVLLVEETRVLGENLRSKSKIGKPNDLKVFRSKKTKESKLDKQNRLELTLKEHLLSVGVIVVLIVW
jgi:hypothetical protein